MLIFVKKHLKIYIFRQFNQIETKKAKTGKILNNLDFGYPNFAQAYS